MNPRLIIWFALAFSTVLYLVMVIMLSGEPGEFEAAARSSYVPVLYGLALAAFLFAWFVVPRAVRSSAHVRMITAMAIFEASAIFGVLAAFLTKDWRMYLAPWALTLFGFIRELPRDESATGRGPA